MKKISQYNVFEKVSEAIDEISVQECEKERLIKRRKIGNFNQRDILRRIRKTTEEFT